MATNICATNSDSHPTTCASHSEDSGRKTTGILCQIKGLQIRGSLSFDTLGKACPAICGPPYSLRNVTACLHSPPFCCIFVQRYADTCWDKEMLIHVLRLIYTSRLQPPSLIHQGCQVAWLSLGLIHCEWSWTTCGVNGKCCCSPDTAWLVKLWELQCTS